jgi:hypothetical protein
LVFYIVVALVVIIPLLFLRFSNKSERWVNFVGSLFTSAIFGAMIFGMFSTGSSDSYTVTNSENTYTVAEGKVPTLVEGNLSFSYTENGVTKELYVPIDNSKIPLEDVNQIKITHKDAMNPAIAPWPTGDGYIAEFIK